MPFTFTIACGVSPTPTPTPRPTPVPWCCYEYTTFNEGFGSETVYFENCDGSSNSQVVSTGYDTLPCMKQNSAFDYSGLVYYTEGSPCYPVPNDCQATPTPTPTFTPTPGPPTATPTPTPRPTYTVGIYAKRAGTPTCIIPPGSGTETQFRIYYSFGLGVPYAIYLVGGSIASNTCNFVGNITVSSGDTLYIGCRSWSYLSAIRYGVASGTSTCPDSGLTAYCGAPNDFGGSSCYSQVITGNTSIAFTSNIISTPDFSGPLDSKGFPTTNCNRFDYCGGSGNS